MIINARNKKIFDFITYAFIFKVMTQQDLTIIMQDMNYVQGHKADM